jgi:hypothetical protein
MNALKAIKPSKLISRVSTLGSAINGLLIALWWETTEVRTFSTFIIFLSFLALAVLDIYARRTRADADAGDVDQQAKSQHLISNPPIVAEWLVALIIMKRRSDGLLGDLAERFDRHVATRGLRRARALYWAEALRSILPILWAKAKKLGVIAAIAEIWRTAHS